MNKKLRNALLILLGVILIYALIPSQSSDENEITAKAEKGNLVVTITSSGELLAAKSENVFAPGQGMRSVNIWQVNITDLIPEGTYVDSGDYIGTLDRGEIGSKLKENEINIQKAQSVFTQTKLDTTLTLRETRNELTNLKFAMEEAKITLDQSKYEPPATIRQNKIALERAEIKYNQAVKNYQVKKLQLAAKMSEAQAPLDQAMKKEEKIKKVLEDFIINAPKAGILIYAKSWNGNKKVVGSRVSAWDPTVAMLPNLSEMISQTYVNEVDIGKVSKGQVVEIELDGDPDKKLTGVVDYVATVGEQLPNSEAKVFEVKINVNETDSSLLPGMSTSNTIVIAKYDEVLKVPIECVYSNDSVSYVYKKSSFGVSRQVVKTGVSNANHIVIEEGLEENDLLLFNEPEDAANMELISYSE